MSRPPLIGTRLRERRLALGMRQGELSRAAAISPSYLNLIEHNRRNVTPEVLERLAAALGLPTGDFTGAEPGALIADLRAASASFPESGAEAEFQIAFLIQKSDEILDTAEAALVEITVEIQLKPVGDCVK